MLGLPRSVRIFASEDFHSCDLCGIGDDPPSPRSQFTAFFSRAAGGVFLLGGKDAASGATLHDVWFYGLPNAFDQNTPGWASIPISDVALGDIQAATYSVDKGFATGPVNVALPDSTMTFKDGTHNQAIGPVGVLDIDDGFHFNLFTPPTFSPSTIWSSAQDNGLDESFPFFSRDALFWTASRDWYQKIHVYTPGGGTKDFIVSDPSLGKSAGDFGTDGVNMVWMEGGAPDGGTTGNYPPASIMTAPYTTNPSNIAKRKLTTEPTGSGVGVNNFVVGCGYAARDMYDRIRLVRISDGQSWLLTPNPSNSNIWSWMTPLVLTCDEMFAYITGDGIANIARVRLDSLGPGTPAN